jgi:uncharacterized protein YjdB
MMKSQSSRAYWEVLAAVVLLSLGIFSASSCGDFFPSSSEVTSITISPYGPLIKPGATQQFSAQATYGNNTTSDVTSTATWTSSATNIATIDSSGLATATATLGTTTITAKSGKRSASTTLTVSNKTVTSLTVASTSGLNQVVSGSTLQLSATVNYSDGSTSDVTSLATWTSGAPGVATVNAAGLVTGITTGTATISAAYGGQSGNITITVD